MNILRLRQGQLLAPTVVKMPRPCMAIGQSEVGNQPQTKSVERIKGDTRDGNGS